LLLCLALLPSQAHGASAPAGQLRGYEAVSAILRQRLLDPTDAATDRFELGIFLGSRDPQGLPVLLGGFTGGGPDLAYRGGVPNAMNVALWYLVAHRVGGALAALCDAPDALLGDAYALAPETKAALLPLCAWPATTVSQLGAFFDRLMGAFPAPGERDAWLTFLETQRGEPGGGAFVRTATRTILLHPDFLLAH
jgi:hypothetical protein